MTILPLVAIDPGNIESAYAVIDAETCRPIAINKLTNDHLSLELPSMASGAALPVVIEQIGHYGTGMPAGATVFDTCRWIGRFEQIIIDAGGYAPRLVKRATVKAHLCGSAKAKDGNVIQALIDRFARDERNHGKGTKAEPGFFYGFRADIWQAFALAVYAADTLNTERTTS